MIPYLNNKFNDPGFGCAIFVTKLFFTIAQKNYIGFKPWEFSDYIKA